MLRVAGRRLSSSLPWRSSRVSSVFISSYPISDVHSLADGSRSILYSSPPSFSLIESEILVVVMGHEFDCYPKKMIRHIRNWDWFIDEPGEDSENDGVGGRKGKSGGRTKRKKGCGGKNDEWTGETKEDKELITKARKVQRPKYLTRSKDNDNHKG